MKPRDGRNPTKRDSSPSSGREAELLRIVEECEQLIRNGAPLDREAVLAKHPELREELASLLAGLELVERAGRALEPPRAEDAAAPMPEVLGDFKILREVGRGGMGIVYEAEQVSLSRRVALKVLPLAAILDPKQIQRFKNEALAAAQLHHTSIVPVFAVGCEGGVHYYAMQFIDGRTIELVVKELRASREAGKPAHEKRDFFESVARIGIESAEALDHAHELGIVHRDIKPSNILLDARGHAWIADFGLARFRIDAGLTATGDLLGTLKYMGPEQAMGKRNTVDHRADVYSLGATLYELLTLEPPFPGTDREELLQRIAFDEPRAPRKLNRQIPQDLETIVQKAMSKEPNARYATAKELADDLRRYVEEKPIRAKRPGLIVRTLRWARRRKSVVIASAAVVFMVAMVGLVAWREQRARLWAGYEKNVRDAVLKIELRRASGSMGAETAGGFGGVLPYLRGELHAFAAAGGKDPLEDAVELLDRAAATYPRRPDAFYHRARALTLLGRKSEAERDILAARQLGDGDWRAASAEAVKATSERRWTDAATAYGRLIEIEFAKGEPYIGSSIETRMGRGTARLEAQELQKAAADFAASMALWPDALEPALFLGRTYHAMGLDALAEETFLEAFTKAQSPDQAAFEVAGFYFSVRRDEQALAWANRMREGPIRERTKACILYWLDRMSDAIAPAERAIALNPRDAEAHVLLGQALNDTGRTQEAIRLLETARKLDPKNAHAVFVLGWIHGTAGDLDAARREYAEAVRLDPRLELLAHDDLAWMLLGKARAEASSYDESIAEAQKAVTLAPALAKAHYTLGVVYLKAGKYEESVREGRDGTRLDEKSAVSYSLLGCALFMLGRREESFEDFRKSIELAPKSSGMHQNLAFYMALEGDFEGAATEFREVIRLSPSFSWPHSSLAEFLRRQGKLSEAEAELRQAVASPYPAWEDSKRTGARLSLGSVLEEAGRFAEALAEYATVLELSPDCAEACVRVRAILRSDRASTLVQEVDQLVSTLEAVVHSHSGSLELRKTLALARIHAGAHRDLAKALEDDLYAASDEITGKESLRILARGGALSTLPPYLEGRLLAQAGEHARAADKFSEAALGDPKRPEPLLGLAESLRAAGNSSAAEETLRGAMVADLSSTREVWMLWAAVALSDLKMAPSDVIHRLPNPNADLEWLLGELAAHRPIHIRCGSKEAYEDKKGAVWSQDRFFTAGKIAVHELPIAGTDDPALYQVERWFNVGEAEHLGYEISLPAGSYRVTLHFAETWFRYAGARKFDVLIEGAKVLDGFEPFAVGFATADRQVIPTRVTDGILNIEFIHRVDNPKVSAIEVEEGE